MTDEMVVTGFVMVHGQFVMVRVVAWFVWSAVLLQFSDGLNCRS